AHPGTPLLDICDRDRVPGAADDVQRLGECPQGSGRLLRRPPRGRRGDLHPASLVLFRSGAVTKGSGPAVLDRGATFRSCDPGEVFSAGVGLGRGQPVSPTSVVSTPSTSPPTPSGTTQHTGCHSGP